MAGSQTFDLDVGFSNSMEILIPKHCVLSSQTSP